jgi:hypothetical protein
MKQLRRLCETLPEHLSAYVLAWVVELNKVLVDGVRVWCGAQVLGRATGVVV